MEVGVAKGIRSLALGVAFTLLGGLIGAVHAAEAQPQILTLQQIVTAAMTENPGVRETQQRWAEKSARIAVAKAWPNPKIGVMKDDIPTDTNDPRRAMMTEYLFSQEIMNPVKLRLMGKMAENDAAMAKATWSDKQMESYAAAKGAYYDILYAAKALEIGKANRDVMGQLVQLAQINYSGGMVPLQDTLRAQTEYAKMTTDLLSMAAMESIAKAKLNVQLGQPADTAFTVQEEFYAPAPQFDLAALEQEALANKPALAGMTQQVEMAKNGIRLAKKSQLPDYELQLSYKERTQTEMQTQPSTWKVGVMVMLPIWQGKNKGEIQAAEANQAATQAALANMQNMAALDIQMAVVEAQTAWRQIELYRTSVIPQAEQTFQAGLISYANGKVDFMAVLDSLNALRNARLDQYKAKINYEKAVAALEKAVGKPLVSLPQ